MNYFDLIDGQIFPFSLDDCESFNMHDCAINIVLKGGSEYKVCDVFESLTREEFLAIGNHLKIKLQNQPKHIISNMVQ